MERAWVARQDRNVDGQHPMFSLLSLTMKGDSSMSVLMIRSKVKAADAAEVEAAAKRLFAALQEAQPRGIRYTSCRLSDGVTYVALLELDEGLENPLPALPEFREFQESLKQWMAEPPIPEPLTVVGSYRFF